METTSNPPPKAVFETRYTNFILFFFYTFTFHLVRWQGYLLKLNGYMAIKFPITLGASRLLNERNLALSWHFRTSFSYMLSSEQV